MNIKFGPAGLGKVKEAISNLEEYSKKGIRACEIAFTYGVYIKEKEDALNIGKVAEKLGISLSIHAPYWINLNSIEPKKVEQSKERILACLKIGTLLKVKKVVFHPGYYGKTSKEETYEKIKNEIIELQKFRKQNRYTPELAPETTGKINVFGSIEEIAQLVRDTECSFTIDFAHILAREKNYSFKRVSEAFRNEKEWHIHFSGIEYSEKGERKHKITQESEIKELLNNLPKNKEYTIINEAPDPIADSVKSIKIYDKS
jgi:deoxyribonuclease-4